MKAAVLLFSVALAGCGSMAPLTPQEAAVLMYMNRPAYQAPQVYAPIQRAPAQTVAPVWVAPTPRPEVNCTTTSSGYALHTTCR
jgi:hypothetical protein